MSFWFYIMIGAYLAMLATVGLMSWRRTKSAEDYIMGGSSIGVMVGMLTFAATLFSTFTLMGMPDFFRQHGVGAWIFLAISDAAMFFLVIWFGLHLRRKAAEHSFQGMSGLLTRCYDSRIAGVVYLMGAFCFLIPYVAIQIRGIAIFLSAVFPEVLPSWGWSVGIVCVMLLYSEFGGLRAIIHCDCIQGTILLIVLWIIAIGCLRFFGGIGPMFEQVKAVNEGLLSTPGPKGLFTPQFLIASFFAILLIPVTQPQVTTRLVIIKNNRTLFHMAVGLGIFTALVLLPTIVIGLYGAVKYGDLATSDFLAKVLLHEQPEFLAAVVVVGLLAAATSTADSQLFALGSEFRSFMLVKRKSPLFVTRLVILTFGAAALIFSIVSSNQLVLLALASFKGTSLMAPMVFSGIFAKRKPGAEIALATAVALLLYLGSLAKWVPGKIGPLQLDLFLLLSLGVLALVSLGIRSRLGKN
ncbi:MAG: sodium:solute symporter family protein [Phycisphaeraceae bacterium]|nr:sodium:solute symporter family protein [Phycisphaeraceae bacterium]